MSVLQPLSCRDIFLLKPVPEQLELFCPGHVFYTTQKDLLNVILFHEKTAEFGNSPSFASSPFSPFFALLDLAWLSFMEVTQCCTDSHQRVYL